VSQNQRDTNENELLTWTVWPLRRPSKMM